MQRKAVLITGAHRSGTTWVGKVCALSPGVGYMHEPFNVLYPNCSCGASFDRWFTYIHAGNEPLYVKHFDHLFQWRYSFFSRIVKARSWDHVLKVAKHSTSHAWYKMGQKRIIMKDPIALFSVEWLYRNFNTQPVIMIRHPAAFAYSLIRKNWHFPFQDLVHQTALMEDYLSSFADEISGAVDSPGTILDQACLIWKLFYHVVTIYRHRHPDWLCVRHEDISNDPDSYFRDIFSSLNLTWSAAVSRAISSSTSEQNVIMPSQARESLKRASKSNIKYWKKCFTQSEQKMIRQKTEAIATTYYGDADW
ncbi:sulfotransferase [candidate division CSSED10-310 bacterium]|uniref:Sulfotransferase n=1 Tax=candidate division CSSED10-310 bacterium TaxID=2855610 RepID=A0ABV6YR14_UNCC1